MTSANHQTRCCKTTPAVYHLMMFTTLFLLFVFATHSTLALPTTTNPPHKSVSADYTLLEVVPHSRTSFTQGLTLHKSTLFEGTGLTHQSRILQHDPSNNMETLSTQKVEPGHVFGEGIACYHVDRQGEDGEMVREYRLIQLTWKDGIGMIYRIQDDENEQETAAAPAASLELIDTFKFNTYTGEGWGITFIPQTNEFYVSDGSEYIFVWDVETLQEKRRMPVTLERSDGTSVRLKYVNELEFVDFKRKCVGRKEVKDWEIHNVYLEECREGDVDQDCSWNGSSADDDSEECKNDSKGGFTSTMSILANVWYQDVLIRIDPVTAKVTRVYDLSNIYPFEQRQKDGADCLNGISVTGSDPDEVWVTGKLWPSMYRIRLID